MERKKFLKTLSEGIVGVRVFQVENLTNLWKTKGMGFISTGHRDIDRVRKRIKNIPTNSANLKKRINTLRLWVRLLSFLGADLNPLREHYINNNLNRSINSFNSKKTKSYQAIDYEYEQLEKIFAGYIANPQQRIVNLNRNRGGNFEVLRDWPTLRGDEGQTGSTKQSGPIKGRLKWKFPAGHAWYATPAFDKDKIYIGSPGVSYEAYCLDTETGEYIWKTQQKENQNQYRTPRCSSPTLIVGNQVIAREIGSGGNQRAAKHFVYLDKNTGEEIKEEFAGHVDYRVGYAPFDGNEDYIVYPYGVQEIGTGKKDRSNVKIVSFDKLICIGTQDGEKKWEYYMGEFYCEPLLDGNRVYCGNYKGAFQCLDTETGKVLWAAESDSPINAKAVLANELVVISNQAGHIMGYDAESGKLRWESTFPTEDRAFQLSSMANIKDNCLYIGSADKNLYSLDLNSGEKKWSIELDDWIRSAPTFVDNKIIAATCSGTVHGIEEIEGVPEIIWKEKISTHGIYADLCTYRQDVYISSSDFYLIKLNPDDGTVHWKTSIFECIFNENGDRIMADLTGGGPDYQAGTTIAEGIAYFGSPRFVYAVDIESGKEIWKFETRGQICGAPAISNGKVFFGQQGGTKNFYCVNAITGSLIWKKSLEWIWASPNVKDGKVYMASVGGTFYCCNQKDGEVIWKYESQEGAYPAPSFKDNLVYFGSWNGNYYAFNRDTGKLRWRFDIKGHPDSGSSMVINGTFFAQGYASKNFYALNANKGTLRWKESLNSEWCNASPTADGEYLLFSTYLPWLHQAPFPSHTFCVDAKTGEQIYHLPFAGGLTGAVICNNTVFTASSTDSYMRAWDLATGKICWQYKMGGRVEESCTSIYGNKALVVCTDGYLYCFE